LKRNMHRGWLLAILLLAMAWPAAAEPPKEKPPQTRTISGQVADQDGRPLADAVVYLKNTKSLAIKSYISDAEGMYHFSSLPPNVDYEVYAEYQDHRSPTRTLSNFDGRTQVVFNLKIDLRK
jgi:carboxypeptidase family protein